MHLTIHGELNWYYPLLPAVHQVTHIILLVSITTRTILYNDTNKYNDF